MVEIKELPIRITVETPNVTVSDTTANVESDFITIQVPPKTTYVIKENDWLYLKPKASDGSAITSGVVRVYKANATKTTKLKIFEATLTQVSEQQDANKKAYFGTTFTADEYEYIIITLESGTAAAAAQLTSEDFTLTATQVIEL